MQRVNLGFRSVRLLGQYWDNGKENGNYYIVIGYIGVIYRVYKDSILYCLGVIGFMGLGVLSFSSLRDGARWRASHAIV